MGCLSNGDEVLALYALDDYSIGQCVAALLGGWVVYSCSHS
jgi:hypothetical protein